MTSQSYSGNMNSSKGQLTIFVILGIVIISVFGFVFFLNSQIQNQRAQQQADQIFSEILSTSPLQLYISLCTEKALKQGLDTIGKQGGVLLPSQPGASSSLPQQKVIFTKDTVRNKNIYVSYGILRGNSPLPQFPCVPGYSMFNIDPAYCEYSSKDARFANLDVGLMQLPYLCKNAVSGCTIEEGGWSSMLSVQSQLEAFMTESIDSCVDFSSIESINRTFNVEKGNITTNISFSDNGVSANVNFPIIISPVASQPITRAVSFQSVVPIRFKAVYTIARNIAGADTTTKYLGRFSVDSFNINRDFNNTIPLKYRNTINFKVKIFENISGRDGFVRIEDTSVEQGLEAVVQFGIENRPPVINYIGDEGKQTVTDCGTYDLIRFENEPLELVPSVFDTEEDFINVSYSGWLFDYEEENTIPSTEKNKPCPASISNKLPKSDPPRYESNGFDRKVTLKKLDIGPHNVTVKVCDAGACDYQIIRILIDDLIQISVNKSNPYNSKIFSIEDPYQFTASIQDSYRPSNYRFTWSIFTPNGVRIYFNESGDQTLNLPNGEYNIFNIKSKYVFTDNDSNTYPLLPGVDEYTIRAKVDQHGNSVINDTKVIPRPCVPFEGLGNKLPYPYTDQEDPFMGAHACCYDNNGVPMLNDSNSVCYAVDTYGSVLSFNQTKYKTSYDTNYVATSSNPDVFSLRLNLVSNQSNDLYKRTFTRKCDGNRGNMCIGSIVENFELIEKCEDLKTNEKARCYGPSLALLNENSETTNPAMTCTLYPSGTTFEKEVFNTNDPTCNFRAKCVSDNNNPNGFSYIDESNLKFICNATCGPNGCSATMPSLCHNCLSSQVCQTASGESPTNRNNYAGNVVSLFVRRWTGCDNNALACNLSSAVSPAITDKCVGDGKNITLVYCNANYLSSTTVNLSTRYDCTNYNRYDAFDYDSQNGVMNSFNLSSQSRCKQYTEGSCPIGTSACQNLGTFSEPLEGKNSTKPSGINAAMYVEYFVSPVTPKICRPKPIDYDLLDSESGSSSAIAQNLCEANSGWKWNSSTGACCGDDIPEPSGCNSN